MSGEAQNTEIAQSDNFSVEEGSSTQLVLGIKSNNAFVDLEVEMENLDDSLKPMALYLLNSPLQKALSAMAQVPLSVLSLAYSSSIYDAARDQIQFSVSRNSSPKVITRQKFCQLFGLPVVSGGVNPDKIPSSILIQMAHRMGHFPELERLSTFKQAKCDPQWYFLITILFKCITERNTGTDSVSKAILGIAYCLYEDSEYDVGKGIWLQFVAGLSHKSRSFEISMARFWSVVVAAVLEKSKDVIVDSNAAVALLPILTFKKIRMYTSKDYRFGGPMTASMDALLPSEHPVTKAYLAQFAEQLPKSKKKRKEGPGSQANLETQKKKTKTKEVPIVISEPAADSEQQQVPKQNLKKRLKKMVQKHQKKKAPQVVMSESEHEEEEEIVEDKDEEDEDYALGGSAGLNDDFDGGNQDKDVEDSVPPKETPVVTASQDSTFDNLENIVTLTQTPPVSTTSQIPISQPPVISEVSVSLVVTPPVSQQPISQVATPIPDVQTDEDVEIIEDEEVEGDNNDGGINLNDFVIPPLQFHDSPPTVEEESLFATKKDVFGVNTKLNALLVAMDVAGIKKGEETVKTLKADFSASHQRSRELFTSVEKYVESLSGDFQGVKKLMQELVDVQTAELKKENERLKSENMEMADVSTKRIHTLLEEKSALMVEKNELLLENEALKTRIDVYEKMESEMDGLQAENRKLHEKFEKMTDANTTAFESLNATLIKKFSALNGALRTISAAVVPKGGEGPNLSPDPNLAMPPPKTTPPTTTQSTISVVPTVNIPPSIQSVPTLPPPVIGQAMQPPRSAVKGIVFKEGSSSSKPAISTFSDSVVTEKDRGKGVAEDPEDLKKKQQQIDLKLRQFDSIKRDAESVKESLKAIMPKWSKNKIEEVAKKCFSRTELKPLLDYKTFVDMNYQLDLPIFGKIFFFKAFDIQNPGSYDLKFMKSNLISFYHKYSQEPGLSWSCMPIVSILKVEKREKHKDLFQNYWILVERGDMRQEFSFTLADLPFINPLDWMHMARILSNLKQADYTTDHRTVNNHLKLMIRSYLQVIARHDSLLSDVLEEKLANVQYNEIKREDVSDGQIIEKPWGIVIGKPDADGKRRNYLIKVDDICTLKTDVYAYLQQKVVTNPNNFSLESHKEVMNRMSWWNAVRNILFNIAKWLEKY